LPRSRLRGWLPTPVVTATPIICPYFEKLEEAVLSAGSELLPVYLQCTVAALENRVANDSRVTMGKLQSIEGLHQALNQWHHIAVPRDECLTIVTEGKTPAECADEIIFSCSLR
jgi:adenylylsulfate kinase-like enzyme